MAMGLRNLIVRRRKILLAVLAVALVAWCGYYLWVTRGAGRAAGIYITGDGGGYVVTERSWIPGRLRVREGMLSFNQNWGVVVQSPEISVSYCNGRMTLRQMIHYQNDRRLNPSSYCNVDLRLVLAPSGDAGRDWELVGAVQDVSMRRNKKSGLFSWSFWIDLADSNSWDECKGKLSRYRGKVHRLPLKSDHDPMPFFLHRINDRRFADYMKRRLYRPSMPEDLDLMRQLVADHPGDPWLDLHLTELEALHGDSDTAVVLLDQWQAAHGDIEDALLRASAETVYKQVHRAIVQRDYPNLETIKEVYIPVQKSQKPLKTLQEYLEWFRNLSRTDGLLLDPNPLVISIYDPARSPQDYVPNFLSIQTSVKVARVIAMFDLMSGQRHDALDLLCGTYRLGQSMSTDGMLINRLIGTALRAISVGGLEIQVLNACETPAEIRALRHRLAWLDQVPHQGTPESILSGEFFGLLGQFDWSNAPYSPNYLEAMTRARDADAQWNNLMMSAAAWESLLTTGDFPESEADFAAMFDGEMPVDPFANDQKPLQFITTTEECVIYSIGPDKSDDKTKVEYDPTNGTLSDGDVLMRVPREREYPFPHGGVHAANAEELLSQFPNGLPLDPFADTKMRPLSILESDERHPVRIFSFGPDADENIYMGTVYYDGLTSPVLHRDNLAQTEMPRNSGPNKQGPAGILIDPYYDPTNGTLSNGDLFMDLPR